MDELFKIMNLSRIGNKLFMMDIVILGNTCHKYFQIKALPHQLTFTDIKL